MGVSGCSVSGSRRSAVEGDTGFCGCCVSTHGGPRDTAALGASLDVSLRDARVALWSVAARARASVVAAVRGVPHGRVGGRRRCRGGQTVVGACRDDGLLHVCYALLCSRPRACQRCGSRTGDVSRS
jgi:hypothetical protein